MIVLFSFIGMTDPIKKLDNEYRDGPLFQIVKKIKPDAVFYVRTAEIVTLDPENRIADALKIIQPKIITHNLDYETFDEPHIFGKFDNELSEIFKNISEQYPNSELYANFSSGTQQLISSLSVFTSHYKYPIKKIQVESPARKSNSHVQRKEERVYELTGEEMVKASVDKSVDLTRCKEFEDNSMLKTRIRGEIQTSIEAYDYRNAKQLYREYKALFPNTDLISEFEKLCYLISLDLDNADKVQTCYIFPKHNSVKEINEIYYYYLYLNTLYHNENILEFSRGVSPIIDKILRFTLKVIYDFEIEKMCFKKKNGQYVIDKRKIKYLNDFISPEIQEQAKINKEALLYNKGMIQTRKLNMIIKAFQIKKLGYDNKVNDKFDRMQEFEEKIRNIAAHTICKITKEDILKSTGMKLSKFINILKFLVVSLVGENYSLDLYDDINKYIADELNK